MSDNHAWDVSVIGAGVVGRAIALDHLRHGISIELIDTNPQQLAAAVESLRAQTGATQLDPARWGSAAQGTRLTPAGTPNRIRCGQAIVIESIVERREPKRLVMAEAEQMVAIDAVLATNTSTIPMTVVTELVKHRGRCCGLHFFMPVDQRPLIEIVTSAATDVSTVEIAQCYAAAVGKQTLVVRDSPGFVVNRMLVPYLNEAVQLLCSGASAAQIERVAISLGMPMSPLELMDWIGMETNFHAGRAIWQAYPHRIEPSPLTPAMVKAKLAGRAGGEGFYVYSDGQRSNHLSRKAQELIDSYTRHRQAYSDHEIACRLFFPMLIEAACILNEEVVRDLDSIERAMRDGLGFRRLGGFFDYFDQQGTVQCIDTLERLATVGRRFESPAGLLDAFRTAGSVSAAMPAMQDTA